jgi:hypothetical protein
MIDEVPGQVCRLAPPRADLHAKWLVDDLPSPIFFTFFFLFRVAPEKFFFLCSPYGESQVVRYSVHKLRGMSSCHWPKILTCLSLDKLK